MTRRSHPAWALYEGLAMVLGLGALALLCLLWLPLALPLKRLLPRAQGQRLGRYVTAAGFRLYLRLLASLCACRFDLTALDQLHQQGPLIVAANHPSLLDAVLILSRLPNAVCVMKASLMHNPLFGAAARLSRYVSNEVPLHMVVRSCEALREGAQLVLFPEGTRTRQFPLDNCQAAVGLIAKRSQVPVQTLLIEFSTPYLGKHWPLLRPPVLPLHCRVRLGRRFEPPHDVAAFTAELQTYFRTALDTNASHGAHPV
ncbi:MAG TPA: lysophospholipid acyltransferase family protein [Macromonas sp.]|nr:lysophospholipid acyltransferase family protein [Macromonas sp.]